MMTRQLRYSRQAMSIATVPERKSLDEIVQANGDALYEVVDGQYVELPPMSVLASYLTSRLFLKMGRFVEDNSVGHVVCETIFILDSERDLRRRPDVAFVSKERWPLDQPIPETGDWRVVPDLAVEVISPNDEVESFFEKLKEYFRYQVRQVWIVLPRDKEVLVYDSPTAHRALTADQELDGGDIIPGFRLSLAEYFKQPVAQS